MAHLGESLSARSASGRDDIDSIAGSSRRFGARGESESPASSISPRGGASALPKLVDGSASPRSYNKGQLSSITSLMNSSKAKSKSARAQHAREMAQRSADISSSYAMTSEQVMDQIQSLEKILATLRRTHKKVEETEPLSVYPCLHKMVHAFEESGFTSIPERPRENPMDGALLGSEASATPAEVTLGMATLNLYRKLAGLNPVKEDQRLTKCAQMLNQVLLPRVPLKLANTHPRTVQLENLAKYLIELLDVKGIQILVLHRTASLKTAMQKCITASHMLDPGIANSQTRREYIQDLRKNVETKEVNHFQQRLSTFGRSTCECPDPTLLGKLHILWEISGRTSEVADMPGEGRSKSSRSNVSGRSSSSSRCPRFRTEAIKCVGSPGDRNSNLSGTLHFSEDQDSAVFWGDEIGALSFRRYLLSSDLAHIGMSRCEDTCVFFAGLPELDDGNDGASDHHALGFSASSSNIPGALAAGTLPTVDENGPQSNEPEVTCFPSPGVFPIEFMMSPHVAWTIMPNSTLYQPTHNTSVQMWKVSIQKSKESGGTNTAERIREIDVRRLQVDCSARGNPFCVVFQPDLTKVEDGDQFEVLLSGLTGKKTEMNFFHEFQSFRKTKKDQGLLKEADTFTSWLANMDFWQTPQASSSDNHRKSTKQENPKELPSDTDRRASRRSMALSMAPEVEANRVDNIEIGLISHPKTTFTHSEVDLTICLHAPRACAMQSAVYIVRAAVRAVEIPRASYVRKIGDRFFVRLKLPMANTRYELRLRASGPWAPLKFEPHPLVYTIHADESVPNLLMSLDHPLTEKYGFAQVQNSMQVYGVTVIAPYSFRLVNSNHVYFLIHVDRHNKNWPTDPRCHEGVEVGPSLFTCRLPEPRKDIGDAKRKMSGLPDVSGLNFSGDQKRPELRIENKRDQLNLSINALSGLYSTIKGGLSRQVQEADDEVHIDIVLNQGNSSSTSVQLQPRSDFPDLFEGLMLFADEDAGSKVEAFIRFPKESKLEYQPYKLAEWLVVRPEHYPIGF
eukprot:gnl/MRDRNA2_/MRDRNA2_57544_c0_seq1.p1 gnl/MRDRNA2_/MRDRNA2_57544_c0~~gnl/MRDRNA2_/MRDRNA2_57544_c0_seq1.p1  ORF type:complete len:1123 (+),score=136.92 gnl/MRDRNA2_/MRDRNA2_57544_c0_seq1:305-3370(+)